jgi:tetratricopeptide (TPR) repeat protein
MGYPKHIDHLLKDWPYRFGEVIARKVRGTDRRSLLQMRVDMGVLQMETTGRPDGERPEGFETYYDYLVSLSFHEGAEFELTARRCMEIDREFVQFYHRRICWLALKEYHQAAEDADHTLKLMDFSTAHSPDDNWSLMHEQYRPFVLFHRTQALALTELEQTDPQQAVATIDKGLGQLREIFEEHEAEDEFDESELVIKLREMRDSLIKHYELGPSLAEQLADAIAKEQYELAAKLRDRMNSHGH